MHNDGTGNTVWLFCNGIPSTKWGIGLEGQQAALGNCNYHHREIGKAVCAVNGGCRMHKGTVWLFCNGKPRHQWGVGPEGQKRALGNCNFHHKGQDVCRAEMLESAPIMMESMMEESAEEMMESMMEESAEEMMESMTEESAV